MQWTYYVTLLFALCGSSFCSINENVIIQSYSEYTSTVMAQQRDQLKAELTGFPLLADNSLSNLTIETGGQPIRSLVVSKFRSGSTFFGDILNSVPGNYYHYEAMSNIRDRNASGVGTIMDQLKSLFRCDYSTLQGYLRHSIEHQNIMLQNKRLPCVDHLHLCWDPRFLNDICKIYPLQSMKLVRLRLDLAEPLLEDQSLNIRMVFLVRDPRGTLNSRYKMHWCKRGCVDPNHLCGELVADYAAAQGLSQKYPKRFRVVRYEDLSLDTFQGTKDIFDFYGLPFERNVEEFLNSHTKEEKGGTSTTFRNSTATALHWITEMSFDQINQIQESCTEAMALWGYQKIENATMKEMNFNPMLPYSL